MVEIRSCRQEAISPTELMLKVKKHYPFATAYPARDTHNFIQELHGKHQGKPTKEVIKTWKPLIDDRAKKSMSDYLHSLPFITVSVGSEGKKEECYGEAAGASLQGSFGKDGQNYPTVWKVSDVVEGTDFAANNVPGSSSVITITTPKGILPTPEDGKYMMKLIAPPQAKGIISLQQDHEKNLTNLINKLGIKPKELTQVTLNTIDEEGKIKKERSVNQKYIDAARNVGVTLVLIDHGDFVPGIRATLDPERNGNKPMIVVGRSGFEEATMDAAAAKALGGFAECQYYYVLPKTKEGEFQYKLGEYLSLDKVVPAPKEEILVSVSSITGDTEHFDMPRVKRRSTDRGHYVRTLVITHGMGIVHRDIYLPD
jgi:fructose-1,6-bisphosphatase/sedoheptulose 1,7-bisphosphatase-like protein